MNNAVLVAAFDSHSTAVDVRTQLVNDGFPTDRVELTSMQELGQAKLVPRDGLPDKLREYFGRLFQDGGEGDGAESVRLFQQAVLDGKAILAVHPRGETEIKRALQFMNESNPVELRSTDLQKQSLEHAAADTETPVLTWMGKVLSAPGARDTTGTARLP